MSQLSLATEAGVSSRHLSFLETGRASPSREMVLRLARALDVPLREQNELLLAAGFAPVYRETKLAAPELAAVERATDMAAAAPWEALGAGPTSRFIDLMTPLALRIASANEAMRVNPMALDPVRELAVPGWNT